MIIYIYSKHNNSIDINNNNRFPFVVTNHQMLTYNEIITNYKFIIKIM